jgi:hypothetical protein
MKVRLPAGKSVLTVRESPPRAQFQQAKITTSIDTFE